MLESMTIIMYAFGMLCTLLMLLSKKEQPVFGILAAVIWFATAAFVISIDVPYTHIYDNSDADNYQLISGEYSTMSAAPLRFMSMGLGFICLGYTIIMVISMLTEAVHDRRSKRV